jgi:hypothetical protein
MGRKDGVKEDGRLGGWSASAVINPSATAVPSPQGQSSFTLQCQLDPPGVYTVQFEVGPSQGVSEGAANIPVATIDFSTNGNSVRRKVSVINGMSISAPSEFIKLKVFDESTDVNALPYLASVSVTPGTRGGDVPPTLQNEAPQDATKNGGTATFAIPQDAGAVTVRVLVWATTLVALNQDLVQVYFLDSAGNPLSAYQNPTLSGFVHIPPEAAQVQAVNGTAIDATVRIIFGIDG